MSYRKPRSRTLYDYVRPKLLKRSGKTVARVLAWESGRYRDRKSGRPRLIVPTRTIYDERDVPKTAVSVDIVIFDAHGNPLPKIRNISRKELKEYEITP